MSVRAARWWLFFLFALALPLPMLGPYEAFVPLVRFLILAGATASVAAVEGAAGPVPGIFLLFAVHALVYGVGLWLLAWVSSRLLGFASPGARRTVVLLAWVVLLFIAIFFDIYATPFGRAQGGNLWSVLS